VIQRAPAHPFPTSGLLKVKRVLCPIDLIAAATPQQIVLCCANTWFNLDGITVGEGFQPFRLVQARSDFRLLEMP